MVFTLSGIVILDRLVQNENVWYPISVNLFDRLIDFKLLQPVNASSPIVSTLFDILTLVKFLHHAKA